MRLLSPQGGRGASQLFFVCTCRLEEGLSAAARLWGLAPFTRSGRAHDLAHDGAPSTPLAGNEYELTHAGGLCPGDIAQDPLTSENARWLAESYAAEDERLLRAYGCGAEGCRKA